MCLFCVCVRVRVRVCVCVCVRVGVDECMVVTLKYSGNRMAVCVMSNALDLPNEAVISGTAGSVRVGEGITT